MLKNGKQLPDPASFRLVALDIDGTVLTRAQEVTPVLKATLERLAGRGVHTVLCTGRRWATTLPVLRQLEHAHPVAVCSGGSLIKEAEGDRTLHKVPLQHGLARYACGLFRECGLLPMLLYDRPSGLPEVLVAEAERECAVSLTYVEANDGAFEWYPGDYPDLDEPPLALYAVDRGDCIAAADGAIRSGIGEQGIVESMLQVRYGMDVVALEVHDRAATKWSAIEWLLREWGIRPEQVIAIGDDVNDLPMLRAAGLGFAMGNAGEAVKAAADGVTSTNEEDGVARALREVFRDEGWEDDRDA
jgi:hydroxymethylpyrimidine pyrophosphatase-like HAD family hydrolase